MNRVTDIAALATTTLQAPPYEQIAGALRRLFLAGGTKVGVDCLRHAMLAEALLKSLGYDANLKVGYVAWRVGPGDGDVIVHAPQSGVAAQAHNAHPYHAWVEVFGAVFDPTVYQFVVKATALDLCDGGVTDVQWAPLYLAAPIEQVQPLHQVLQEEVGMFYYEHVPALQAAIMASVAPVDAEEFKIANIIFSHPSAQAFGAERVAALLAA